MGYLNRRLVGTGIAIWACCAAVMGMARSLTTQDNALLIHAAAAPVIAAALSYAYFRVTGSTRVLATAAALTAIPALLDLVVVATLLLRSYDMFGSVIGTWIPFCLIFVSSHLTGRFVTGGRTVKALPAA